jgi:hypothetical protein
VFTQAHEVLAPDPPKSLGVEVTRDPEGGWRIDALRDGRVVATRHSDDWHRVERMRHALAAGLTSVPEYRRPRAAANAAATTGTR